MGVFLLSLVLLRSSSPQPAQLQSLKLCGRVSLGGERGERDRDRVPVVDVGHRDPSPDQPRQALLVGGAVAVGNPRRTVLRRSQRRGLSSGEDRACVGWTVHVCFSLPYLPNVQWLKLCPLKPRMPPPPDSGPVTGVRPDDLTARPPAQ